MITIATFCIAAIGTFYFWQVRGSGEVSVRAFLRHCLPWARLKSHSTKVDVAIYLISKVTQRFISVASAALTAGLVAGAVHLLVHTGGGHPRAGWLAIGLLGLAVFVCADFGDFLSHYLQHKIPFLWQFHRVHHSALFLTPLTGARFHPVGNLLDGIFIGLLLAAPASVAVVVFHFGLAKVVAVSGAGDLLATVLLLKVLQHSHFNIGFGVFERVFISPRMHQLHHSARREHWDRNMASSLAVWDWLFGTALIPAHGEALVYGLGTAEDERGDYGSVVWCYVAPLVGCWGMLRRWVAPVAVADAAAPADGVVG